MGKSVGRSVTGGVVGSGDGGVVLGVPDGRCVGESKGARVGIGVNDSK